VYCLNLTGNAVIQAQLVPLFCFLAYLTVSNVLLLLHLLELPDLVGRYAVLVYSCPVLLHLGLPDSFNFKDVHLAQF
jgi:hypothetical protein